jgi:hypothetical protein
VIVVEAERWPLASGRDSVLACNSDTIEKRARRDYQGFPPAGLLDRSRISSMASFANVCTFSAFSVLPSSIARVAPR